MSGSPSWPVVRAVIRAVADLQPCPATLLVAAAFCGGGLSAFMSLAMNAIIDPLQYAILPVFGFLALGFIMGRRGLFDRVAAEGTNRYVTEIALPALFFLLLARTEIGAVDWNVIAVYITSNLTLYAFGYLVCWRLFRLSRREAILVAFTAALPNHVFFILPIIENWYGPEAALPVALMIPFDVVIMFAGTSLIMEALAGDRTPTQTLGAIARNPALVTIAAGAGFAASGLSLHAGIERFLSLGAASAAPAALFSLGVVLSAEDLRRIGGPALFASLTKVILHPLIALIVFGYFVPAAPDWEPAAILVFAAPCGAMAFVIGMRYHVPVGNVAKAIILSTSLSVFTISFFA